MTRRWKRRSSQRSGMLGKQRRLLATGLCLLVAAERPCVGQESAAPSLPEIRVLLVHAQKDTSLSTSLRGAALPQLSLVDVSAETCDEQTAENLAAEHGATAVLCSTKDATHQSLYYSIFSADRRIRNVRIFERQSASSDTLVQSEIIRGWLEALIAMNAPASPSMKAPAHKEALARQIGDPEIPIQQKSTAPPEGKQTPEKTPTNTVRKPENRLFFKAAYTLSVQSHTHPFVHGAVLSLGGRIYRRLYLAASYLFVFPTHDEVDGMTLELRQHPVWLAAGFSQIAGRFEIGGEVAFSFDYVTGTSTASPPLVNDFGDGQWRFAIVPMVVAAFQIAGPFRFFISLGAELYVHQSRYVADINGKVTTIHEEWLVEPRFLAGASVTFF